MYETENKILHVVRVTFIFSHILLIHLHITPYLAPLFKNRNLCRSEKKRACVCVCVCEVSVREINSH